MFIVDDLPALAQRWGSTALTDVEQVEAIRALEELKAAAAAEQARLAIDLRAARVRADADRGVPAAHRGRGVASEIALARRESLHRGQQHLALARILPAELPHTNAAFRAGQITEWRATLIARETACLTLSDRLTIDQRLAANPERLEAMGDAETTAEARKFVYQLDPASFVGRRRRAESDRRVTLRPAPDVMSQLSALLPVKDGVCVYAALKHAADAAVVAGDARGRGQIMADTLVARVTGNLQPTETTSSAVSITINVIVPDAVLTGQSDEAGYLENYGPIPADLARELAAGADWLRRLYAQPATGALVAMDSHQRLFPQALARFLRLRDRTCRMPWCDAPIRHTDHAQEAETGGPTNAINGQGLCEAHNHTKQAHGWTARPRPGPRHTIETTTPTGHTNETTAPPAGEPHYIEIQPGLWRRSDLVLAT